MIIAVVVAVLVDLVVLVVITVQVLHSDLFDYVLYDMCSLGRSPPYGKDGDTNSSPN